MKRIITICLLLLFCVFNQISIAGAKEQKLLKQERLFVDSFLQIHFAKSVSIGAPIVIMKELFNEDFEYFSRPNRREQLLDEAKKKNQKLFEAVNDFCIKNDRTTNNLESIGTISVKHVVLNEKQILEILSGGWELLRKR